MQLRLAAGPLHDAATAARICAALVEGGRTCETTVFDGQRLAMSAGEDGAAARRQTGDAKRSDRERTGESAPRHSAADRKDEPPTPQQAAKTRIVDVNFRQCSGAAGGNSRISFCFYSSL